MSNEINKLNTLKKLLNFAENSDIDEFKKLSDELENSDYIDFNNKSNIKFINKSNNADPIYNHEGDSGFDLRAFINEPITLNRFDRILVPTGLYFGIPKGMEMQVRSRSGLAIKNGIMVLNSPGTVDQSYEGEIKVILINMGSDPFIITNGDRIAQGVFCGVLGSQYMTFEKTDEIKSISTRGEGGFGSTNIS